ncbi:hypothetical protein Apa02nite_101210 [Actinoplanes palleronii]|uniref:Uncharacterized protein n=1 Tax=Actinoplanes palleronii TaxID=113570 RepID=A0ABQ4BTL2_9ACTN|nr:hypothetical protein Apa02nite_101210 [Actinoplanes palleronii]
MGAARDDPERTICRDRTTTSRDGRARRRAASGVADRNQPGPRLANQAGTGLPAGTRTAWRDPAACRGRSLAWWGRSAGW